MFNIVCRWQQIYFSKVYQAMDVLFLPEGQYFCVLAYY